MSFSVFISHSVSDLDVIYQFKYWLEANRIEVYVGDTQPQYGILLPVKLSNAINQSDCVIAILTTYGDRSAWVNQEISYAARAGKLIVPIIEAGVDFKGFVLGVEHIPFQPQDPATAITNVINYLGKFRATEEQRQKLQAGMLMLFGILAIKSIGNK